MLEPDLWIHWLHLMAAIVWVGSMAFTSLVVQPVLRKFLKPEDRLAIYAEVGRRYLWIQWGAWAVLAATGLAKLWTLRTTPEIFMGPFGGILGMKLALIAFMAVLSVLHSHSWGPRLVEIGTSHPDYPSLAARTAFWGRINFALVVAIVFCAALLRFNPW